jgi:hypothetical protein
VNDAPVANTDIATAINTTLASINVLERNGSGQQHVDGDSGDMRTSAQECDHQR